MPVFCPAQISTARAHAPKGSQTVSTNRYDTVPVKTAGSTLSPSTK